jgi:hypothetical protein
MWFARMFKVISRTQATKWKLTYYRTVYGDEINKLNCRSLWMDNKNRFYRVKDLY